jgi:hypothetical protein
MSKKESDEKMIELIKKINSDRFCWKKDDLKKAEHNQEEQKENSDK